jgi:hypothetical protein
MECADLGYGMCPARRSGHPRSKHRRRSMQTTLQVAVVSAVVCFSGTDALAQRLVVPRVSVSSAQVQPHALIPPRRNTVNVVVPNTAVGMHVTPRIIRVLPNSISPSTPYTVYPNGTSNTVAHAFPPNTITVTLPNTAVPRTNTTDRHTTTIPGPDFLRRNLPPRLPDSLPVQGMARDNDPAALPGTISRPLPITTTGPQNPAHPESTLTTALVTPTAASPGNPPTSSSRSRTDLGTTPGLFGTPPGTNPTTPSSPRASHTDLGTPAGDFRTPPGTSPTTPADDRSAPRVSNQSCRRPFRASGFQPVLATGRNPDSSAITGDGSHHAAECHYHHDA